MDISAFLIGVILPDKISESSRRTTIAAVNDDDSGTYSDSDGSYDGTRSELEAKVDKMVKERPELD